MTRLFGGLLAALLTLSAGILPARAVEIITIEQYSSPAPNVFGSPSWAGYLANAMTSLQGSLGNIGNQSLSPTAYRQLAGTFEPGMIQVSSFPSWMGTANPTGAFAGEYGTRLHWGAAITVTGGTFTLQDVSFAFHSNDAAGNYTDAFYCPSGVGGSLCWENNLTGTNFSTGSRVGVDSGGNPCNISNPCTDTTPLLALYYVGPGNAFWPGGSDPVPSSPLLGPQGAIDDTTAYIMGNVTQLSNTFCVKGTCATSTLQLEVPEPASLALLGLGMAGITMLRRRAK